MSEEKEYTFHIEYLFCPKCGKQMMADTHNPDKNVWFDNWWCNECEVFIDMDIAQELFE
jgi:transcription elongation factor Elf1